MRSGDMQGTLVQKGCGTRNKASPYVYFGGLWATVCDIGGFWAGCSKVTEIIPSEDPSPVLLRPNSIVVNAGPFIKIFPCNHFINIK